jgi:hypothetical protein
LLEKYKEEYFQKLSLWLRNSDIDPDILNIFLNFSTQQQKEFLLHPDVSCLLNYLDSVAERNQFIIELEYFCSYQEDRLTLSQGNIIPGTNIRLMLEDNNPENIQF